MSEYDTLIEERLQVQGQNIAQKIIDSDEWNKLSIDSIDQDFIDEFNKVINDNRLPKIDGRRHMH
jgi:ATP-dependent protease HslVU (ClpYQ) ATPase subunit